MVISEQELREKIKELRGSQSRADFGKRFGVSRQAVERWETGTAAPKPSILAQLGIEAAFVVVNPEEPA